MTDKKQVPPSLAEFALEQLAEAGEQAAIDLTVQNVEILQAEIVKRDARLAELEEENARQVRITSHWQEKVDTLEAELTPHRIASGRAMAQQPSAGVVLPELRQVVTDALMGMIAAVCNATPPADQPPPPFIQSAIDRAVDRIARLNPCRAQAVQVNHDSDCSTNNHGVPELLGPCDCSASKDK